MISDGLKLHDAIEIFLGVLAAQQPRERDAIMSHQLSATEWDELQVIADILAPLKDVSSMMEGNITGVGGFHGNGALADVLPGFDHLLDHLERSKAMLAGKGREFASLRTCVNLAWKKLDEYYKLTDDSAVYLVASVLDPRLKMMYFEDAWADRPEWIRTARQRLFRCSLRIHPFDCRYRDDYDRLMTLEPLPTSSSLQVTQVVDAPRSEFLVWKYGNSAVAASDELERYLGIDRETDPLLDVHAWWLQHQTQYPLLFRMAIDVMSIPCMSAEAERVFSRYFSCLSYTDFTEQS